MNRTRRSRPLSALKREFVPVLLLPLACLLLTGAPLMAAGGELEGRIKALEGQLKHLKQELASQKAAQASSLATAYKAATAGLPGWIKRMKLYGDIRQRYQQQNFGTLNGVDRDSRGRFLVRLRVGVKSQIHPDVEIGFRMTLGANDDATGTNITYDGFFREHADWGVDLVYVKWQPGYLPDRMLTFLFGKVVLPVMTTKAMWDGDVRPEGAFLSLAVNKKSSVQGFFNLGVFFVEEHGSDPPDDIYGWVLQAGVKASFKPVQVILAVGYYDWGDFGEPGNLPPNIHGNPTFTSNGATRLSEFGVFDVLGRLNLKLAHQIKLGFVGHYLKNTDASGPNDSEDTGWLLGGKINWQKWWFGINYKYVEANASPGFISDSDTGFVNRKGYELILGYKFMRRGELRIRYFDTEPVEESLSGAINSVNTIYISCIFKF